MEVTGGAGDGEAGGESAGKANTTRFSDRGVLPPGARSTLRGVPAAAAGTLVDLRGSSGVDAAVTGALEDVGALLPAAYTRMTSRFDLFRAARAFKASKSKSTRQCCLAIALTVPQRRFNAPRPDMEHLQAEERHTEAVSDFGSDLVERTRVYSQLPPLRVYSPASRL